MIAMDDVSDKNKIWRMLTAEFLGTAMLLFVGCGSTIWLKGLDSSDVIKIALTFGFAIATLVQVRLFESTRHTAHYVCDDDTSVIKDA